MTEATEATKTGPSAVKSDAARAIPHDRTSADTAPAGSATAGGTAPGRVASRFPAGSADLTAVGSPPLAHDGEPAGLARVTLAMRPAEKQAPAPGRLVALASWATAIGIAGLLLAARSAIALLTHPPSWFVPCAVTTGLVGIVCTGAAFLTARQRIVPWTLLGVATCAIGVSVLLISLVGDPPSISSIP